jgi:hypothetical protein
MRIYPLKWIIWLQIHFRQSTSPYKHFIHKRVRYLTYINLLMSCHGTNMSIQPLIDYDGMRLSQNCSHQWTCCSSPGDMWKICEHGEPWRWWCWLGITPDSSTRALWLSYQQRHLGQVEGMDEGMRILPISIWNTSRNLLTCHKI